MNGLVSVVIPTYNRSSLLKAAVESVRAQTYRPVEVIVVDDGSTDDTAEVVAALGVGYVAQQNKGPAAARNRGVLEARGEFVAFLDSDDLFEPDKLRRQVAYLRQHPDAGLIYTSYTLVREDGSATPQALPFLAGRIQKRLLFGCSVATPTVLVRRHVLATVGGFDESLHLMEDVDLWCRIARQCDIGFLPEPLCRVRAHAGNMTRGVQVAKRRACWWYVAKKAFAQNPDMDWRYRRRLRSHVLFVSWLEAQAPGNRVLGRDLLRALRAWPFSREVWHGLALAGVLIPFSRLCRRVLPVPVYRRGQAMYRSFSRAS